MGKVVAVCLLLTISACQHRPTDVFCQTHSVADFRPSQATLEAMSPEERRSRLKILSEGEKRCGWRP